jgi:hypothetical protein
VEVHHSFLCPTNSVASLSLSLSLPWPIGPSQVHNYSLSLFDSGPIPHFRASTAALAPSTARFSIAMARGSGGLAP